MSRLVSTLVFVALFVFLGACTDREKASKTSSTPAFDHTAVGKFAYGEVASDAQIAGWDIDVRPDGVGLPVGQGSVEDGEPLYEEKCAECHGSFGEGSGRYPVLAGGEDTLTEPRPEKTIGSYWPYASTLWDYIHRAMPFAAPESLSDSEVYAITAYVLHLNDIVDYEFVLTQDNLASIEMPNTNSFFPDDRPDVKNELCMHDCKEAASIQILSEPELSAGPADTGNAENQVQEDHAGRAIYDQACALCHTTGVADAPILGDSQAWAPRLALGVNELRQSVIKGKGTMPPKGGFSDLSDDDVTAAVDFMIEKVGQ